MTQRHQAPPLTEQQLFDWLRLIRSDNVGPSMFRKLINRFGSAQNALAALPDLIKNSTAKRAIRIAPASQISAEIDKTLNFGAAFIVLSDQAYPQLLREIEDAPPVLTYIGCTEILQKPCVALVGARNASAAGMTMTRNVARQLGEAGYAIASGLARGIDTAAHHAALESGTIAVFAGGINYIYPEQNIELAHKIVDEGGMLLTERAFGSQPRAQDFPRRNRIVSGLSLAVVVIEAALRSGSLITARMALEQNRDVMAVPGFPLDPRAEGGNKLIRDGARLIRNADDVLTEIQTNSPKQRSFFEEETSTDLSFEYAPAHEAQNAQHTIINALSHTPIAMDEITRQTGLSSAIVQTILLDLEIAGRLERASGQLVSLRP